MIQFFVSYPLYYKKSRRNSFTLNDEEKEWIESFIFVLHAFF